MLSHMTFLESRGKEHLSCVRSTVLFYYKYQACALLKTDMASQSQILRISERLLVEVVYRGVGIFALLALLKESQNSPSLAPRQCTCTLLDFRCFCDRSGLHFSRSIAAISSK